MTPRRYRLDGTWRRPGDGTVVIAGSPLRLFRLSTGGAQVAAMVEAGTHPDTASVHQVLDRFVEAGALHPEFDESPYTAADVTIVVPSFGGVPGHLVDQMHAHVAAGGQAIVVDDATPDRPPPEESVHVMPGPSILRLRHDMNRGPGAARNTGLKATNTRLVAFVDTDVELPDGWLAPLLRQFADERVALVAPRVAGRPGTDWLASYETRHSPLDLGDEPARIAVGTRVGYVPAAAIVCSTAAVRELGGFDETLRYGEDVDLVWRLVSTGYRCRYEPASIVHHVARASFGELLRQRVGYGRSAAPLAARHPRALAPVRMNGWSMAVWALVAMRRPWSAVAVAAATTGALVRRLRDVPPAESVRMAVTGHLAAGRQLADALRRVWWPAAAVVALLSRRARLPLLAALIVPPVADAIGERSSQPLVDAPVRLADQVAYGAGVWAGVFAQGNVEPLLPEIRSWPQRGGE